MNHWSIVLIHVEPLENVDHFGDQVTGPVGDTVGRAWNSHQSGIDLQQLQSLIVLLGLRHRCAVVGFSGKHHGRCGDIAHQGEGRPLQVVLGVIPGEASPDVNCRGVPPSAGRTKRWL